MGKKLTLLGMAIAAVTAFAIPATASASPELRDHEGKVAVGAEITGTSTNAITTNTALGTLTCPHVLIKGSVTANSGTHIAAVGTAGTTSAICDASGQQLTVTKPTLLSLTTNGSDKGTLSMTFIADVGPFECHYAGSGEFTYNTGTTMDNLFIAGVQLTSSEICMPEKGVPVFEGTFTLTTENNNAPIWVV